MAPGPLSKAEQKTRLKDAIFPLSERDIKPLILSFWELHKKKKPIRLCQMGS